MGDGAFYSQNQNAKDLRNGLESVVVTSEVEQEGAFLDHPLPVNTGVNTRMVVIDKSENCLQSTKVNQADPFYVHYQNEARKFNQLPEQERASSHIYQPPAREGSRDVRRNLVPRIARVEANGMPSWIRNSQSGVADYRGVQINGPEDLADIAQGYRNPSYETMRYFFVKDGEIVGQNAVSLRLPGVSSVFFGKTIAEQEASGDKIASAAASIGATGDYLLHNHPNGDPTASIWGIA